MSLVGRTDRGVVSHLTFYFTGQLCLCWVCRYVIINVFRNIIRDGTDELKLKTISVMTGHVSLLVYLSRSVMGWVALFVLLRKNYYFKLINIIPPSSSLSACVHLS
ncbi:hypothetical protein VNO78_20330 [Psophocarpus tetragonolobus]|uniref:Uncharacterized protein n=1 Tax=Psophocarpus tetragonolobus TaxID=3891 RepID=A0AAN9SA57_PSOTE